MADPSLQVFRMPFSADGKSFGTLVIDAEVTETSSDGGGALPLRSVTSRMAPGQPQALVFSTPTFAPGNTKADVQVNVNSQLGGKLPEDPVEVEVLLGPMQALDQTQFSGGELLKKCAVRVSDVMIEWDTEPAEYKQGDRIVLPADGKTEFTLIVRAQRLVPGQGVIPDDDDIEFTHMVKPNTITEPVHEVFGPVERPTERREERSNWRSAMELPNPARNISLPAECIIQVKAWGPKGSVTRAGWNNIFLSSNAKLKDLIRIPVVLVEPKAVVELLEPPEMPLPANGEPQDLTLQLFWEIAAEGAKSKKPASGLEVTVEQKPDPKAKFDSKYEQPSQPADEEGKVTFRYTPPKLTYKPGEKYYEDFDVCTGKGESKRKIGEGRIYLSPEIRIRFKGEKQREHKGAEFGLDFEPREIVIPADAKVHTVAGKAWLQPSGNRPNEKKLEVNAAKLSLEFWNGTDFVGEGASGPSVETKTDGTFTWDFKELIPEKGKRSDGTHELDEETEAPLAALNPKAEELIAFYEDKVNQFCPFDILSPELVTDIKDYRAVYRDHLAKQKIDQFIKIISATEALRAASTYAHSYRKFYDVIAQIVVEQLKDLFMAIVEVVLSLTEAAAKFAKWLGGKLKSLVNSGSGLTKLIGEKASKRVMDAAQSLVAWLNANLERLSRQRTPGKPLSEWERFLAKIWNESNALMEQTRNSNDVIGFLAGAFTIVAKYLLALVGNWFKQLMFALPMNVWRLVAPIVVGVVNSEHFEKWVGQIAEDTFKMIVKWFNDLLTAAGAGSRPVIDIAAMFDCFTPTVETVLREVHTAAQDLNVPEDYQVRQDNLKNGFVALRDSGLKGELNSIETDLAFEEFGMLLTAFQYFLIAVSTFTTLIGGALVAAACKWISVAWGSLRGAFRLLSGVPASYTSAVAITLHYRAQVKQLIQ